MTRRVVRANGTEEQLPKPVSVGEVLKLIDATCLDTVRLLGGWVMLVDDAGFAKGLPENRTATAFYHAVCRPGTTWPIRGDVVIALDDDFGGDDDA